MGTLEDVIQKEKERQEQVELSKTYKEKREEQYKKRADVKDLADFYFKKKSGDPALVAEGEADETAWLAERAKIKAEFPKP